MPKFTKSERERLRQIVLHCNIQRVSNKETLNTIYKELGINIKLAYLVKLKRRIRDEAGEWIDTLTKGKYDYIAEYKARIDEMQNIVKERYKLFQDPNTKPYLKNEILTELRNDTLAITDLYQSTPILSGLKLKVDKIKDLENKIQELEQEKD